jgi:ABC-2 type transport system permease protein
LLLLVVPATAVSLAGIGALIGCLARDPGESGAFSLLCTLLLLALGPVVIPPARLPHFMLLLGHFSPATYAASALRQTLIGPLTPAIVIDLAVLALTAAGVFALVVRLMDWRQR